MANLIESHELEYYATDGRLCGTDNRKIYRIRDVISLSEKLGRPLTEEEMKEFYIGEEPEVDDSIAI